MGRPVIWAGLYILLIPLFAVVYVFMPENSFYQATAKYDQAIVADRDRIIAGLTESIRVEAHLPRTLPNGLSIGGATVLSYSVSDDIFVVEPAKIGLAVEAHTKTIVGVARLVVSIDPQSAIFPSDERAVSPVTVEPALVFGKYRIVTADLFPISSLEMPAALRTAMLSYKKAHSGFPTLSSSDQLGRMIYFSATTATTLGTGDILPVTPLARLLTALQAILGILSVGFFLNAIATRVNRR